MKKTGRKILDEAVFAGPPLGADMRQMRATQDDPPPPPDAEELSEKDGTCPSCGYKGKSKKDGTCPKCGAKMEESKDEEDDERGELDSMVPHQSLVSFQSFYLEGKFEDAAKVMADALGVDDEDDPLELDDEKVKAEWARFIAEQESKFSFLRKSMIKFNTFLGTAKSSWDKLPEAQKKSAAKFLKSKASKMGTELKTLLSGLDEKSPADKVMMAAMLAYMFGVGMSGEGAITGESDE